MNAQDWSSLQWTGWMYSAYKLNKQGDNIPPWRTPFPIWNQSVVPCPVLTVASWPAYSFSRGRSGGLVFPCLSEFSTVYCDPHNRRLWHSQESRNKCFSLPFSMIQRMLAVWSLVPLPFLKPAWTSGSSQFTIAEAWLGEFWACGSLSILWDCLS